MSRPNPFGNVPRVTSEPESLVELRVLEGPNLYFPRAAIKLTLDISGLAAASEESARRFASRIGLRNARPGAPDSGFRQRFALRAVGRLVRAIATEAGTSRLGVRVRPTSDPHQIVVAYPWAHRERAQVMGHAVADVLDAVNRGDVEETVGLVAEKVRTAEPGARPHTITPRIPVVAVTGTNGKTTTSRMIAHIARTDGRLVGWSNTDGIYIDGELVEAGDYSGPSGAGRVLAHENVEFAVTETARGGILLKGIGLTRNDVSVVTNVTADHLGLHGIDTLDQLAEVKGVVPRITRKGGWAVLNGDDPRVLAMRPTIVAQPWVFSRDPSSPAIREVLDAGGRATTVIDGWVAVLRAGADPAPLASHRPAGIQIFAWLATIWAGRALWRTPLLFVLGFLVIFVLGGITGVMVAAPPFDLQAHDSHFIVGHLHYVLIGGVAFPIFAGVYYCFPKFIGRMLSERVGRGNF